MQNDKLPIRPIDLIMNTAEDDSPLHKPAKTKGNTGYDS